MSFHPEYKDGENYIFMNTSLVHYPYAAGFWGDHFVMSTNTGHHFFLPANQQVVDDSSVA